MKRIVMATLIVFVCIQLASATMTDTPVLYDLKGYPGDVITVNITLTGTNPERIGHWETYYKHIKGDTEKMNITSWIAIEPNDYTLKEGESKTFTVTIKIPENAKLGLYGVVSPDASAVGYGHLRRIYLKFTDADASAVNAGGSVVWTGFRIPVSINVLGVPVKPSPFEGITETIKSNIITIALFAVIIVLLTVLLRRRKSS